MPAFGVVVAAAGEGTRMGGTVRKPLRALGGRPILARALDAFARIPGIRARVAVVHPRDLDRAPRTVGRSGRGVRFVAGGERRQDSVLAGLRALPLSCTHALVHDAARPLVSAAAIRRVMAAALRSGAASLALPLKDTPKRDDGRGRILKTVPREGLWRAQTPQAFRRGLLLRALERASRLGVEVTDEAQAVERLGVRVALVPGEETNLKITTPGDLRIAEALLALH